MADLERVRSYWCSPESRKVQRWLAKDEVWTEDDVEWNQRPDVTFVREYLAPRFSGRRVLDVGAGTGRWVHLWRRCGVELLSAELSPMHTPLLAERSAAAGARWMEMDIATGKLDEQFDLVFSSMLLIHIHPTQIESALRNMGAMARNEIVFTTWHDPDQYDDASSTKVQSFSHRYEEMFERLDWRTVFRCRVDYASREKKPGIRQLWHLEVP